MPKVQVGAVKLHYVCRGKGAPLVLVMGYRLNLDAWPTRFVDSLASRFSVVLIDNRGTGRSDKPVEGYALANMARDVLAVATALKLDRFHLLGYSMGGAIAQECALLAPERVDRLVLAATFPGRSNGVVPARPVIAAMREAADGTPEDHARRMWPFTYSPSYLHAHRDDTERQMHREIAHPTPLHAADLQLQAIVDFDSYDRLPQITAPTLVLTGSADALVPPQNAAILARRIPNARLQVLDGPGHRVFWEAPEETADLVTEHLGRTEARAA